MIVPILSLALFLVFAILSGFHVYWLFGGKWGLESVFPTKPNQNIVHAPPKFATLVVALGLAFFGIMYLVKSGFVNVPFPTWLTTYGYWIIPSIFILRAIGEFNYLGFFKKVKNTKFAEADSKIFAPLCLSMGIIGMLIQFLS